mgnify:CR=1 FL=1
MTDILIAGGGIIGMMTARELLLAGASVRVLERQATGRESSWAGGGILSPLYPWRVAEPINRLFLWSHHHYPALVQSLAETTGIDPEWTRSGLLVADHWGEPGEQQAIEGWAEQYGLSLEWWAPHTAQTRAAHLAWNGCVPLFLPDIAQVRNPRLLAAVRQDIIRMGADIREHEPVRRIVLERDAVRGFETRTGVYAADTYIMATGAWSDTLGLELDTQTDSIHPVKGQMLIFPAAVGTLQHILLSRGKYLIPRKDGRILTGSTLEYTGFDKTTTDEALQELMGFARSWLPDIPIVVEKHWAGLRPGSRLGIPRIARHPHLANLYFNCGHFRNGFVMAPASARLLTDQILGRDSFTEIPAYQW